MTGGPLEMTRRAREMTEGPLDRTGGGIALVEMAGQAGHDDEWSRL